MSDLPGYRPDFVTAQGAHLPDFKCPCLDGSMYVPEWIDWHIEESPNHTFAVLVGAAGEENVQVTWGEIGRAVHRLAAKFLDDIPDGPANASGQPRTIGLYLNVDSLTYVTTIMALFRAGFEPFPLSTRNSLPALEHLITSTDCSCVIAAVSESGSVPTTLEETANKLRQSIATINILKVSKWHELYPRLATFPPKPYDAELDIEITPILPSVRSLSSYQGADDRWPALVLHSSGTNRFPQPIHVRHSPLVTWSTCFWYGDLDVGGKVFAAMGLPLFHPVGYFLSVMMPMTSGTIAAMLRPTETNDVLTSDKVLEVSARSRADYVLSVPSICEEWSINPDAIKYLASLEGLLYAGGPLAQERGDQLIKGGVNLINAYGAVEFGIVFKLFESKPLKGDGWLYCQFSPDLEYQLVPEGDGLFRLVILEGRVHSVSVWNVEDPRGFDTKDLLEEHPVHKGYWKVAGRADDQIMMSNGEKTNPGPLETIICGNPFVRGAVMFGRGRAQAGIAIEPSPDVTITTDQDLYDYRNKIWAHIEQANAFAPSHSRIFKELILVVDPAKKPFVRTPKGTIARSAVLKQYESEIEALYARAEGTVNESWAEPPEVWDESTIPLFVYQVVNGIMRNGVVPSIEPDRDLFEQGCDSLQATHIRNAILGVLRNPGTAKPRGVSGDPSSISQNLVYMHPTISKLTAYLADFTLGSRYSRQADVADPVSNMTAMVEKYCVNLPVPDRNHHERQLSTSRIVLVTGTTGALGTYLLHGLITDPVVTRVYAVNRAKGKTELLKRQQESCIERDIDPDTLLSPKLRLIEADLTQPTLGLDAALCAEISSSITDIIHAAWQPDFNLGLSSFESHVAGTRQLVDFSLLSCGPHPPRFTFISSVSVLGRWNEERAVPEQLLVDPRAALGTGYGESKWVAERLLIAAAEARALDVTIWRVAQLCGSTVNGAWNVTEWVPIIARTGHAMRSLPSLPNTAVNWVPIDIAAKAIVDGLHSLKSSAPKCFNLAHPQPTDWDTLMSAAAVQLTVPLVPAETWFSELEKKCEGSSADMARYPALKLAAFFRDQSRDASGAHATLGSSRLLPALKLQLETAEACKASVTLSQLRPLQADDVSKWMHYWTGRGLFSP